MNFVPRLTTPSVNNKYWIHTSKGGLNDCILIGAKSVLPNCVGYAFGRAYEILDNYPKLSKNNAGGWFNHNDGYERGQTPKLGAIGVWRKKGTTKNWGHVGVVEEIKENNTIVTSNSAYEGSRFYLKEIKPPYHLNNYEFLGFIYLPINIDNKPNTNLPKLSTLEVAKKVINGEYGNGIDRKNKLESEGYNFSEIQTKVNELIYGKMNNKPETNINYKIGDKVHFDYLYTDSYASRKLKSIIHSGKITKIYEGRKAPYLINNGSGFLSKDLILFKD